MKFTADIDVEGIIKLRQEINKLKNSLKAVAGIPNSDAAIKQLEKEIEAATKKLEEYENKYLQIQKLKHDIDSSNDAVKKAKEETAALQRPPKQHRVRRCETAPFAGPRETPSLLWKMKTREDIRPDRLFPKD